MERLSPLFECEENSSDYCSSLSTTESDGFKEVITKVFELDIRNGERIKLGESASKHAADLTDKESRSVAASDQR